MILPRDPYFLPGEKVIVDSRVSPQYNGEYYIESVQYYIPGHTTEQGNPIPEGFYYYIVETDLQWQESSLKKIHIGAGKSLEEMVKELNTNN